jgi:Sulfotransferase family
VLIDKTALNTLNIELINTIFPDSVIIFALRDPRDVCLSCFMQPFTLSPLTANFLTWTETARFYALIMDYWLSIRDSLSLQWIELRYEDMLNDLEGQFRPIFTKMGLKWSAECREFYRHSQRKIIKTPSFDQVTRPLYTSSIHRWRNYEEHFAPILPVLKPYIERFGYDLI